MSQELNKLNAPVEILITGLDFLADNLPNGVNLPLGLNEIIAEAVNSIPGMEKKVDPNNIVINYSLFRRSDSDE